MDTCKQKFTPNDLPDILPIFPLSGVLLLPRGELPLNIFEPRYVAMVEQALTTPHRLIGMIQPQDDDSNALYQTGCAGRITSFTETEDGQYLITLSGITRFHIAAELPQLHGYRRVTPDYDAYAADLSACPGAKVDKTRLCSLLKEYFKAEGLSCKWQSIQDADDVALITTLAMVCPFSASEKQALLEAPNAAARADTFITMLEMAVMACSCGDDEESDPRCH